MRVISARRRNRFSTKSFVRNRKGTRGHWTKGSNGDSTDLILDPSWIYLADRSNWRRIHTGATIRFPLFFSLPFRVGDGGGDGGTKGSEKRANRSLSARQPPSLDRFRINKYCRMIDRCASGQDITSTGPDTRLRVPRRVPTFSPPFFFFFLFIYLLAHRVICHRATMIALRTGPDRRRVKIRVRI